MPLGGAPNLGGIAWSPDGKVIASTFSSATSAGLVQVWDPQTGQIAYTQAGWGFGAIAWLPDGQEFVYSDRGVPGTKASVTILNVTSGQKVYTFQSSEPTAQVDSIGGLWSPTGTYIVSVENIQAATTTASIPQQSYVVKVWVA